MAYRKSTRTKDIRKTVIFQFLLLIGIELAIILASFKLVRSLMSPSSILEGNSITVGYSQYNGYPFYFDTIIFLIIMVSPFLIFAFLKKIN